MGATAYHVCPICGREAPPRRASSVTMGETPKPPAQPANPAFPFCSPACKLVDLGRWLDGGYRFEGLPVESSIDADLIAHRPDKDEA